MVGAKKEDQVGFSNPSRLVLEIDGVEVVLGAEHKLGW